MADKANAANNAGREVDAAIEQQDNRVNGNGILKGEGPA